MMPFISSGSSQLFVGPASSFVGEQMNVRSSTRATSVGSEAAQNEFGFLSRATNVPASTSSLVRRSHSSLEPSHHTILSGVVSSAHSATHWASSA